MAHAIISPTKSSLVGDTYKFGDGPEPVLQPERWAGNHRENFKK